MTRSACGQLDRINGQLIITFTPIVLPAADPMFFLEPEYIASEDQRRQWLLPLEWSGPANIPSHHWAQVITGSSQLILFVLAN